MSAATETNSVVISPPAVSASYAEQLFRLVAAPRSGISERISSACSSSISSRVSARSSGVICVTSSAACRGVIASRNSVRSSSSRYSSTSAARVGGSAGRKRRSCSRGEQLDDVGEIGRVQLFRLGGDVRRRLLEQREDVRREQRRDGRSSGSC